MGQKGTHVLSSFGPGLLLPTMDTPGGHYILLFSSTVLLQGKTPDVVEIPRGFRDVAVKIRPSCKEI